MSSQHELSQANAFADVLENRINGFWNEDYFTKVILPLLNLKAGGKVLDVGAGNGALTLLLARHCPDVHFTGVDITSRLVEDAKQLSQKLGIQNVEFMEGDALQLPLEDESFDATVCQTVLMHLPDPAKAVSEMSRVLRQGGTFMAAEYHMLNYDKPVESGSPINALEEEVSISRYIQILIHGYRALGQGDLKMGGRVPFLAREAGLKIVDIRINDRVTHAFPPYQRLSEQMSLTELQGWEALIKDPSYRSWLSGMMIAGGGTEADADALLRLLPSHSAEVFNGKDDFAFVWLPNPVLLVTIARK